MDTQYPLHLLATFQRFYPDQTPTWIVKPPGYEVWLGMARCSFEGIQLSDGQTLTKINLQSAKLKQNVLKRPLPHWGRYAAGVWWMMCGEDQHLSGLCGAIINHETFAPRYDYAVGLAFAEVMYRALDKPYQPETLRDWVERVRKEYING